MSPVWPKLPYYSLIFDVIAGETVFYNSNILHCATYDCRSPRATLHACMGNTRGGNARARNILQHGLEWMKYERFFNTLPEGRAKKMWANLVEMEKGNDGKRVYSLEGWVAIITKITVSIGRGTTLSIKYRIYTVSTSTIPGPLIKDRNTWFSQHHYLGKHGHLSNEYWWGRETIWAWSHPDVARSFEPRKRDENALIICKEALSSFMMAKRWGEDNQR